MQNQETGGGLADLCDPTNGFRVRAVGLRRMSIQYKPTLSVNVLKNSNNNNNIIMITTIIIIIIIIIII